MSPKKMSARPLAAIRPPTMPTLRAFCHSTHTAGSTNSAPSTSAAAAAHTLLVHTRAAKEPAGAEV